MKTPLKMTITAALPLASLLWMTPPAVAYDMHHSQEHRRSWSDSSSYRAPFYGRSTGWERHHRDRSSWDYGKKHQKYSKAMHRLSRQEREAREKAARRYEGDRRDPRYRERLAEIDRKYDQKRYQVRRNLRND
jgi:hypothetical protein